MTAWFNQGDYLLDLTLGAAIVVTDASYARHKLPLWVACEPLSAGNYGEALRRLTLLKRLYLTSPNLWHMTGTVLMFAGRNREAEEPSGDVSLTSCQLSCAVFTS